MRQGAWNRRSPAAPAVLAVLPMAPAADAGSLARQCRQACGDEIASCVAGGGRRLACKRQMLRRCRTEGLGVCQGPEAPAILAGSCTSPTVISAQGGTFTGTTSGTSLLAGSCGSSGNSPERVFQWTPTVSGTATIQTCGGNTSYDTVLYVRSGACGTGSEIALGCNDDACADATGANRASRITPTVTAGQTYYIFVDGFGGAQGNFTLTVLPPVPTTTTTLPPPTTSTTSTTTTTRPPTTTTTTLPPPTTTSTTSTTTSTTSTTTTTRPPTTTTTTLPPPTTSTTSTTTSTTSTTTTTRPPTTTTTTLGDTVSPSVPTALSASAPSCSQINLGWNPSTDSGGSGLKGYNVYRNSDFVKQILMPGTTTSDPGMAASTVYTYNVAAIDNAGNTSGMSVAASTNTPACATGGQGQFIWNRQFGGVGVFDAAHAMAVATDPSGNVVVAGSFEGTVNFGTGPMTSSGFKDVFVAKYSAAGVPLWAKAYGDPNDDEEALGVAMDGSGSVVVTGYFKQTVNFGTGPLTAAGTYLGDVFVAKYSASGAPLWVKQVGSSGFDKGTAIAVDGASTVLVTGYLNGTVNFGLGTITSAGGPDVFLVKYTPEGAPLWAKRFGGSGFDVAHGIAVDGGGNVAVTGDFQNTADFGTGLLQTAGGRDIFLAEYSPDGAPLWSRSFGGTSEDGATSVALDGSGNVIVTGSFTGAVDFGGGLLPDLGGGDIFLAKYSPSGAHLWSKRFGGGGSLGEQAAGVTADGAGNVILTGAILDSVSFGGPVLWSDQTYDIYVAKFTAAGAYLWSRRAGEGYDDSGLAVAADGSGNALVAGYFSVAAAVGGGRLTSPGGTDGFVVKYAP